LIYLSGPFGGEESATWRGEEERKRKERRRKGKSQGRDDYSLIQYGRVTYGQMGRQSDSSDVAVDCEQKLGNLL